MSEVKPGGWESLRALTSGLIHDLNNFLAPIFLYGELLEQEAPDEAAQKKIRTILSRADQIQHLLASVRMLYKDDEWESFILPRTFVENLSQLLAPLARKKNAQINWYLQADAPRLSRDVFEEKWQMILPLADLLNDLEPRSNLAVFWAAVGAGVQIDVYTSGGNSPQQAHADAPSMVNMLPDGITLEEILERFNQQSPILSVKLP